MMKREKRRAPPTAIAVSVSSLEKKHHYFVPDQNIPLRADQDTLWRGGQNIIFSGRQHGKAHRAEPSNEDIHEAAEYEDKEAGVEGGTDVREVSLGLQGGTVE